MPPVIPNPDAIHSFRNQAAFEKWLAANHDKAGEIWIKVHKKNSGLESIKINEALDVALSWGWIDAIRKSFDEQSYLQRYTPRQKRSIWSRINTDHIARLTKAGRMQAPGLAQVAMAKADGRWDAAYSGSRDMKLPDDLAQALAKNKVAQAMYDTLTSQNRYALAFRIGHIKTEATRAKKVAQFVAMLERGETIYPNGAGGAKKSGAKKTAAKKGAAKKATAKKGAAKKADAKKGAAKQSTAQKLAMKKVSLKRSVAKKGVASKSPVR